MLPSKATFQAAKEHGESSNASLQETTSGPGRWLGGFGHLVAKPCDLRLIPETYMVQGEDWPLPTSYPLNPTCFAPFMHTHTHKINQSINKQNAFLEGVFFHQAGGRVFWQCATLAYRMSWVLSLQYHVGEGGDDFLLVNWEKWLLL